MPGWKKLLLFLLSLLPLICAGGIAIGTKLNNVYVVKISLNGEQEILLEYGETYVDPGATAESWGTHLDKNPIPADVTVESNVNEKTVGTYQVTYTATSRGGHDTVVRTVRVVDTVAPVITLTENPEAYTLPGHPYNEEGFLATDNCDGDITSKVEFREADGKVIYSVSDHSGNTTTVERPIRYYDPEPPVLTLVGSKKHIMSAGKAYTDPGYSASDNCDGDITGKVVVSGSVDGFAPGTYTLTYTVMDTYGNTTEVQRTVQVVPHKVQEYVEHPGKVIYLTFDDGPGPHTERLLDILKKYNVKATFFVVNTSWIGAIARAAGEGHTVAMHTTTHVFQNVYANEDAYFNDLYSMQSIIKQYTGQEPMILRFPGGSSNTISNFNKGIMSRLVPMVKALGFRFFDWNVDSKDAGGAKNAEQVFQNVIAGIGNKQYAVVLQHDIKGFSVDAVERIINWGLENGYTFLPLTMDSPVCEHNIYN